MGVRENKNLRFFPTPCSQPPTPFPFETQQMDFYETMNFDVLVKKRNSIKIVIPAKAGIQLFEDVLDPGFRRGDASRDFLRVHQN